jgi:predicted transcriptional regulator
LWRVFGAGFLGGMQTIERDTRLVTVRVPRQLVEKLEAAAQASDRSRSAELRMALREHLERTEDNE